MWCYLNHLLNIIDIFLVTVRVDCSNIGFVVAVFMMFALYWRMNRHVQFRLVYIYYKATVVKEQACRCSYILLHDDLVIFSFAEFSPI